MDFATPDDNLYAPPKAQIVDAVETFDADARQFYVVAPGKFLLLFATTVGMYSLYWFWRHWKLYKVRYSLDLWPVPRAIFQIFFAHSLNREIDFRLRRVEPRYRWSSSANATVFVVFSIASSILDRLAYKSIGSPLTDLLSIAALLPVAYALLQTQKAANVVCGDPRGESNRRLSVANYLWAILGLLFWALILLGLLVAFGVLE